jgi:hypothetical protein
MRTTLILSMCSVLTVVLIGCKPAEEKTERYQGAPEQYIRTTLGAGENAKATLGTIAIQKAIEMFQLQQGRFPSSLAELQKEGFLPQIPEAPVNKKFSYDPATGKVSVVDK